MSVHIITADEAMARFDHFDAVIDARTEDEHAQDHLPGALNWPSLNNEERIRVGTLYKQVSPFEAQKIGAALVAANISRHIQTHVLDKPKNWRALIYCWRGGKRSNSLAFILGQIGFKVHLIEGGYKAFRQAVLQDTPRRVAPLHLNVLCGPTGCGKTRLLHALAAQGAQVLDLEALANHRASVLGVIPGQPQPTQKRFETRLWDRLRRFDPAQPVFVEAESKKVGNVSIPDSLMAAMRAAPCVRLALSLEHRVQLLMEDYEHFVNDTAFFCQRLERLSDLKGHAVVGAWQAQVRAGQTAAVVADLLQRHYDPGYEHSTARNFGQYAQAPVLNLASPAEADLLQAARQVIELGA
ncbi:MAG: tRNA 2-selenouridine(34) synthase MnmH [Betaproteobacteria bacterium]|nr:tRNA 2-selenouridine(34) synthase MnmH [Betaproteobacteria bacterium]